MPPKTPARTRADVDSYLQTLGFDLTPTGGIFTSLGGHEIVVTVGGVAEDSEIDYGKVVVHHRSTRSFRQPESLVVLQCVTDLLSRGYAANAIELEKGWPLGHKNSGRLDVYLKDPAGTPFAMIECKTRAAYIRARNKTLEDGGQLFSYFAQQRDVSELYLYSCQPWSTDLDVFAEAIPTGALNGGSAEALHSSWDRSFLPWGMFHPESEPYDRTFRGLFKSELRELDRESGRGVFNSFAEILRHNVVSDKPNAFNKIFNLFLCKIADEDDKQNEEEMDFQWRYGDTGEALLDRLQTLYTLGLENYLGIVPDSKYQSPIAEFSFIDVYDAATFRANLSILREVVELLQQFRIKYSARQQHLGDFFEMLLNSGLKQESGQFFTPVPLAQAILRSLPVEELMLAKVEAKKTDVIPHTIDFACGAGHFLTEAISEISQVAADVLPGRLRGTAHARYEAGIPYHHWAKEYVYGVEKDHRLAKVTKIATFLNGDGEANIVQGDGLGAHSTASGFFGRLVSPTPDEPLRRFDILVANPPFSVSNFRRDLDGGADRFKLYKHLTAQSGEIECLFLERASQLLSDGGVAGIIFPLSILNNSRSVYSAARRLLAIDFQVCGLLELREKTFIATPTSTVCMFLRRRSTEALLGAAEALVKFDGTVEAALKSEGLDAAVTEVRELPATDPATVLEAAYDSDVLAHSLRTILDADRETLVAFSGESVKDQQRFLGYRFTRARGADGLRLIGTGSTVETKMFDPDRDSAADRMSTQLRRCFSGEALAVPDNAKAYMQNRSPASVWSAGSWHLLNPSAFFVEDADVDSYNPLGDFIYDLPGNEKTVGDWIDNGRCVFVRGVTYPKGAETPNSTDYGILTASNLDLASRRIVGDPARFLRDDSHTRQTQKPQPDDIVICTSSGSLRHLGKIAWCDDAVDAYIGGFLGILRCDNVASRRILEANLLSRRFRQLMAQSKEQNISNLTEGKLREVVLHVPTDDDAFLKARADRLSTTS